MAIREEFIEKGNSEILSCRSLVNDLELIKFIANMLGARGSADKEFTDFLRKAIDKTKKDKTDKAVIQSANSITLLVAAQYPFSAQDLSDVSIKGEIHKYNYLYLRTQSINFDCLIFMGCSILASKQYLFQKSFKIPEQPPNFCHDVLIRRNQNLLSQN